MKVTVPGADTVIRTSRRLTASVQHHGVGGTARLFVRHVKPGPRAEQRLVWYGLDLRSPERPRPQLDEGLVLRQGGLDDMWLLDQFPQDPWVSTMLRYVVKDRLAIDGALWLVHEGDRAAFRCWIFESWFPMPEARARGFDLPPDVVALEDSLTSPAFRGRGVARSAWAMIADTYGERGKRWMITKVAVENTVSRRAVEAVGFGELGIMQIVHRDWRTRVRVLPMAGAEREHLWLTGLDRG